MTTQRSFKRRVRARMAKTGERYSAARRILLPPDVTTAPDVRAAPDVTAAPEPPARTVPMPFTEEALVKATGQGWQPWCDLLDAWGAADQGHTEIARWLSIDQGVDGWWAQSITVGYERARGRRAPGERPDGFNVGVSKTVGVPVEVLYDAFVDARIRRAWLPDAPLRQRTATRPRHARYDWADGMRVVVYVAPKGESSSTITIQHERIPDAETLEALRASWRAGLADLKRRLESGGGSRR
jgi:hypothetical protein